MRANGDGPVKDIAEDAAVFLGGVELGVKYGVALAKGEAVHGNLLLQIGLMDDAKVADIADGPEGAAGLRRERGGRGKGVRWDWRGATAGRNPAGAGLLGGCGGFFVRFRWGLRRRRRGALGATGRL
jgi:hypothetical protein